MKAMIGEVVLHEVCHQLQSVANGHVVVLSCSRAKSHAETKLVVKRVKMSIFVPL